MNIRFWGVRGTIPSPGQETRNIGGNTPCIEVRSSDGQIVAIDAGTGIRRLGINLCAENPQQIEGTILISHTHWDHIQGLPFFCPLDREEIEHSRFEIIGRRRVGQRLEKILANQFQEPYLPFTFGQLTADIAVQEIGDGDSFQIGESVRVKAAELIHPGGCLGFRIEEQGQVFAYCTDTGHPDGQFTENVLKLADGADLLVHDAQFTLAQRMELGRYGHSSWLEAARVAREAGAKRLALFHYDPDSSDAHLHQILAKARQEFQATILSREGLSIDLGQFEA